MVMLNLQTVIPKKEDIEKLEVIKEKLEENYTNVIFVGMGKFFDGSVWKINENCELVKVLHTTKTEEINVNIEYEKVKNSFKPGTTWEKVAEKMYFFRECMSKGLIATDARVYKKYTAKKLEEMLNKSN